MIIQKCRQVNRFFPPPKKFTFFSPAATRGFDGAAPHGRPNFLPAFTCDTQGLCRGRAARAPALFACIHLRYTGGFAGAAPHGRPNFLPAFTRRRTGISLPAAVDVMRALCRGRAARAAELFTRVHSGALPGPRRTGGRTFHPRSPADTRAYLCPRRLTAAAAYAIIYIMKKQKSRAPYQRAYGRTPRAACGAERRRDAAARTTHSTQR